MPIEQPDLQIKPVSEADIPALLALVKELADYEHLSHLVTATEEKLKETFKKQLLLVAGFKVDEIGKIDLANMSDEEFQSLVRQRLVGIMENNGNKQKVIDLGQVENFISDGWEYVASLPNDRAIVKTPF